MVPAQFEANTEAMHYTGASIQIHLNDDFTWTADTNGLECKSFDNEAIILDCRVVFPDRLDAPFCQGR